MKLHPVEWQGFMAQAHDLIYLTLVIAGPGRDLETVWQGTMLDHERMITGRSERIVQAGKPTRIIMVYRRGLAMHDLPGMYHLTTHRLTDTLVTETDTKGRITSLQTLYHLERDTGLGW